MYNKCCILLSGGIGTRIGGDIPKQYLSVKDRPIIAYTIERLLSWPGMDSIVIVADDAWHAALKDITDPLIKSMSPSVSIIGYARPGENRQESILNALEKIEHVVSKRAYLMIHDAVRPCVSRDLIERCDAAMPSHDGVMPYLPLKETVYISSGKKRINEVIDRSTLISGQTPEFFRFGKYLDANRALSHDELMKICGSSEPAVMSGMDICPVIGDEDNFKITTPGDLIKFEKLVKDHEYYR